MALSPPIFPSSMEKYPSYHDPYNWYPPYSYSYSRTASKFSPRSNKSSYSYGASPEHFSPSFAYSSRRAYPSPAFSYHKVTSQPARGAGYPISKTSNYEYSSAPYGPAYSYVSSKKPGYGYFKIPHKEDYDTYYEDTVTTYEYLYPRPSYRRPESVYTALESETSNIRRAPPRRASHASNAFPATERVPRVATRKDAKRAGIPTGYSFKHWNRSLTNSVKKRKQEKLLLHKHLFGYHSSQTQTKISKKRQYVIEGFIGNKAIAAVPDTGAEVNICSTSLTSELGLDVDSSEAQQISLPSGQVIKSSGTVKLPWRYSGETVVHELTCHVLQKCVDNLILCRSFLGMNFVHRLKTFFTPVSTRLSLKLLGNEKQRVMGSINGRRIAGLPDMGSDVNLISWKLVDLLGLRVDCSSTRRVELEFADGSRCFTDGVVENVPWKFNSCDTIFKRKFYVLKNLPIDTILSNDFPYESNAFTTYASDFCIMENITSSTLPYELSIVKHIGWFMDRLQTLYENRILNKSLQLSSPEDDLSREQILRNKIRDEIDKLPSNKQQEAMNVELERRRQWKARRARGESASTSDSSTQTP